EEQKNGSSFTGFVLLGFSDRSQPELVLFVYLLYLHFAGKHTTILLPKLCPNFYTSMYFFLTSISFLHLCTYQHCPTATGYSQRTDKSISYGGCVVQLYILGLLSTESILLGIMAFNHYAAVCKSLRYTVIMHPRLCALVASASWLVCFANSILQTVLTFLLPFCGRNILEHLCVVCPLLKHGCVDTTMNESEFFFVGVIILLIPIVLIMFSHGQIVRAKQRKSFGTCGSHLTVVSLFCGRAIYVYLQPSNNYSQDQGKFISSVFYTSIIPMIDPLIYTLGNKDVKGAFKKIPSKGCDS
uniref:G-protein coupled receptors family 1 profile domain-containing protein n=1 Tax=Loxodonta africana TaxID=9785 RepID=G3TRW8_LOXAF